MGTSLGGINLSLGNIAIAMLVVAGASLLLAWLFGFATKTAFSIRVFMAAMLVAILCNIGMAVLEGPDAALMSGIIFSIAAILVTVVAGIVEVLMGGAKA